jgi:hypothetical protein
MTSNNWFVWECVINIKLLLFILFLSTSSIIVAQNHMDIMTTMTGEHIYSLMGAQMTTLDWNGDGYDDLIVLSPNWDPRGYTPVYPPFPCGKYYIYFGGPNFDNVPEMEMPGTHEIEYGNITSMCNAGDMNGDGIDDLALFRATMYEDNNDQHYDLQLCVFYGGANPDTIPDYVITFPREDFDNDTYVHIRSLGDINNDGFNDLGYIIGMNYYPNPYRFGIIHGGSMENTIFKDIGNRQFASDFTGIGDVNADGIDDFCIGYMHWVNSNNYGRIMLYYGNSTSIYRDSLMIADNSDVRSSFSYPTGDLNWDGYSDFVSSFTSSTAKLYYGGPGFNGTQFVTFSPPYNGDSS